MPDFTPDEYDDKVFPELFKKERPKSDCRWEFIRDWEGDPTIPNGTRDLSRWECATCGAECYDRDPPPNCPEENNDE